MKTILFLSLLTFTQVSFAFSTSTHCDELSILYTSKLESLDPSQRLEAFKNIDEAFELLCKEEHAIGARVLYANHALATSNFGSQDETLYYPNGSVMMETDSQGDSIWYYPNGEMITEESANRLADLIYGFDRIVAKIEAPFKSKHSACAPGCSYVSWGIWGDAAHKKRYSCHNSGEAIDIHAITCKGATSAALSKKFDSYVACMRSKFKVIYRVKNHFGHAHIQIPNCRKIKLK